MDYSLQSDWITQRLDSMAQNGMLEVDKGSKGQATLNPNLTPDIIPFPK